MFIVLMFISIEKKKNNIFELNLSFYKQLRGTAIGTKMTPSYAIIFLGDSEERFFSNSDISLLVCWRYTDDNFMLWQYGEKRLEKFLEILNSFHPTIKFTSNNSREKIRFLDVEVRKKGTQLVTDLDIKTTDSHKYFHASSYHVFHSKKFIPYRQALRLNRICSENSFFDKGCNNLEIWLKGGGYSDKLVWKQNLKARKFSRTKLPNNQRKEETEYILVLNITYPLHPGSIKNQNDQNIQ